jgi:lipid II:glycine glycyltransferase (peptidoglycan interpeptide bridge formation enzyme)
VNVRDAAPDELADWDARTVDVPGGHVYQSKAWAEFRRGQGWGVCRLMVDERAAAIVLTRPWPVVGGGSAYIPRGPVAIDADVAAAAARLAAVVDHLADGGVDVVASDAEIPAATGYQARLHAIGFRPIPEIQPSRHRMSLPLPDGSDDDAVRSGMTKSTRQRIAQAERSRLRVARFDTAGWAGDGRGGGDGGDSADGGNPPDGALFSAPGRPLDAALDAFYDLLGSTGERRGFTFGPRDRFVPWWRIAHDAGHLVYLEARDRDEPVGGLILYRHGRRLSTVHSADTASARREHPGVMHLLRWRAIQLAMREGRDEMDLGGVDVGPDHRRPEPGEPLYGLYEHKRGFGAEWVEMSGAHERIVRPWRYAAGRLVSRLSR